MNREEAINNVRSFLGQLTEECQESIRTLIPELNESEDERIRKAISNAICGATAEAVLEANGVKLVDALAYLEKQKEQKPAEKISVSEELYEHIRNACACIDDAMSSDTMRDMTNYLEMANSSAQKALDMVDKSIVKKPAEWSEEDRTMRMKVLKYLSTRCSVFEYEEVEDWLNSIRPQPHWKPSDEQMKWLESAVRLSTKPRIHGIIISLYENLKRL